MGWAIKRPDGTYRAWNACAKDDVLQPGETWEQLAVAPTITAPVQPDRLAPLKAKLDVAVADLAVPAAVRDVLAEWKKTL